jgi:hypothetical protein
MQRTPDRNRWFADRYEAEQPFGPRTSLSRLSWRPPEQKPRRARGLAHQGSSGDIPGWGKQPPSYSMLSAAGGFVQ